MRKRTSVRFYLILRKTYNERTELEQLKYPIGRFKIYLSDNQLDTPYRENSLDNEQVIIIVQAVLINDICFKLAGGKPPQKPYFAKTSCRINRL